MLLLILVFFESTNAYITSFNPGRGCGGTSQIRTSRVFGDSANCTLKILPYGTELGKITVRLSLN